jgi:DNA-binding NtrC family response regulator
MPHVLVVDDDDDIRDVLYDFFMEEGYQVSLARNGEEALVALEREHNLVVLLDLSMPGIDGAGVLGALQAQQRRDHQVVVMTAGQRGAQTQGWLASGAVQAVVQKPFNIDRLLLLVERLARQLTEGR